MSAGHFACLGYRFLREKLLSSDAKKSDNLAGRFCLCKLGGQDLKIPLGNRGVFRIQHTQIRLKSPVSTFTQKCR